MGGGRSVRRNYPTGLGWERREHWGEQQTYLLGDDMATLELEITD